MVVPQSGVVKRYEASFSADKYVHSEWRVAPVSGFYSKRDEGAPGPSPLGTGDGGRTTHGTTTNPGLPIIPPRCWGRLGVPHSGPQQSVKTRTVLLQGAPPFCQAPQFPRHPPNPTKQTTNPAKISWPTLHAINPQKRTIEVVLRRANIMDQYIRKIVEVSRPAHAAMPSPKRRQKCRKSAQITPGNHLSTSTPSTT